MMTMFLYMYASNAISRKSIKMATNYMVAESLIGYQFLCVNYSNYIFIDYKLLLVAMITTSIPTFRKGQWQVAYIPVISTARN